MSQLSSSCTSGKSCPFPLAEFEGGSLASAYGCLGAHRRDGGWEFLLWAPRAQSVSVTGDFCGWDALAYPMEKEPGGLWRRFIPGLREFDSYKYSIVSGGRARLKADPYAFHAETRPATASKLYDISGYEWHDGPWLRYRRRAGAEASPMTVYECHPGSWRRNGEHFMSYRMLADSLVPYVKSLGFTHIELLPLSEHPLDDSWGYQTSGFFAPTSRFGTPKDLMYFVDRCHAAGLGVLLDWTPAHFCTDEFGLIELDGAPLYEYSDPLLMEHRGWGTRVFDLGRGEVRSFLLSSAMLWLREYHFDGLRVDACASMLYLDYDRAPGQWRPNRYGGKENLESIAFFQALNRETARLDPSLICAAEESTAWPGVTAPPETGGLGFGLKWNMGWMNDLLSYISADPMWRGGLRRRLVFSLEYAFSEKYILPLSHDEVVHMKGSLYGKMPGSRGQKLNNLRLLLAWQYAHPGKKLLFMGAELAQEREWRFGGELDWFLLQNPENRAMTEFTRDLNEFYLSCPALWERDFDPSGFEWYEKDGEAAAFFRRGAALSLLCAFNFAGIPCSLPLPEGYRSAAFSTVSGAKTEDGILTIPPLGAVFLKESEDK